MLKDLQRKRVEEFVRYHLEGDGECNNVVLCAWADNHQLDFRDRYLLSVFFSITYCVGSAIMLFNEQKENGKIDLTKGALQRPELIFQSDRKYMRMRDSFQKCLEEFYRSNSDVKRFVEKTFTGESIDLAKAIPFVSGWKMYGRFSAYLLLETFACLAGCKVINTTIEWEKGDTATSGLLNVYGYDEQANQFDKTGKLAVKKESMDEMLSRLIQIIEIGGGDPNVTKIETSLCAYRKFFKGSRYNGFYLDRMLEEINKQEQYYPEIAQEQKEIRKRKFDPVFLGEINGWDGIRKDMKKYYLTTGQVNNL